MQCSAVQCSAVLMTCPSFSLAEDAEDVLHNLSFCCDCGERVAEFYCNLNAETVGDSIEDDEGSLVTFSVELARAFIALALLVLLLLCYSTSVTLHSSVLFYYLLLQAKSIGSDNCQLYCNMCVTMDSILCPSKPQVRSVLLCLLY